MVLESLESETPNIKDLALDEREHSITNFDPKTAIDPEVITKKIEGLEEVDDYVSEAKLLANVRCFNPDFFIEQFSRDTLQEHLLRRLMGAQEDLFTTDYQKIFELGSLIKQLFPEKWDQSLVEDYRDLVITLMATKVSIDDLKGWLETAYNVTILFPDFVTQNKFASFQEGFQSDLPDLIKEIYNIKEVRTVFPKIKFEVSGEVWREIVQDFYENRDGDLNLQDLTQMVASMAFIQAREVKVTDQGIELIGNRFDNINEKPMPPLPHQRSF